MKTKNTLLLTTIILLVSTISVPADETDWVRGATLQNATVARWNSATAANKLATCGNWIAAWEKAGLTAKKYGPLSDLRPDAEELRGCLNQALQGARDTETVNPYAAICASQLGILRQQ